MRLFLIRHAWAEPLSHDFPDEEARPLTAEGRNRFEQFAAHLAAAGIAPQRIAHSPLVRTQETATLLADSHTGHVHLEPLEALVPDVDLAALLSWTAGVPATDTAWVGHAPDIGEVAATLIGSGQPLDFGAGAVAAIEFDGAPVEGAGRLRWFAEADLFSI